MGYENVTPGVLFPPPDQPFSASTHEFFEECGDKEAVLRPIGSNFAHEWSEWRALMFSRKDVLELWPAIIVQSKTPISDDEIQATLLLYKENKGKTPTARDWKSISFSDHVTKARYEKVLKETFGATQGRPVKNVLK